jgi:two-component system chemotaxis sensor kinase CheA
MQKPFCLQHPIGVSPSLQYLFASSIPTLGPVACAVGGEHAVGVISFVESKELLQKAQEDTLRLEADPGNDQVLASIFRAFHTIKGGAGFLEASNLVEWAHDLEDLLDKLRNHTLPITSPRIDAILKGMDVIERMFRTLSEEREPDPGPADLGRVIKALATVESESPGTGVSENPDRRAEEVPAEASHPAESSSAPVDAPIASPLESRPAPAKDSARTSEPGRSPTPAPQMQRASEAVESTLRVDANRLDAVMNQVGELVLLRNRLTSAVGTLGKENENMTRIAREVDLTVSDLQQYRVASRVRIESTGF